MLEEKIEGFLNRRKKMLKWWDYLGPVLFLIVIGYVVFVYFKAPLLINPFEVLSRIQAGTIKGSTLEFMAAILPVVIIAICFVMIALVAIMYAASINEKKYLKIINDLRKGFEKGKDIKP